MKQQTANSLSFWEAQHWLYYDYLVIGSGIVGLSAAVSLAEQHPTATIAVLERGLLPTGASTRNAGFACFGSLTELLADLQTMPENTVLDLVRSRWQGLHKLRHRLGDAAIGYEGLGGYELITEKEYPALQHIERLNEWLQSIVGNATYTRKDEQIKTFGFNSQKIKALVFNQYEGQLNTGLLMKALLHHAQRLQIQVFTGCEVAGWQDHPNGVEVQVKDQARQDLLTLYCKKLLICTNAFTTLLLPELDIKAGRGQIFVTKPIENLPFQGAFHYDEGYFYFRNIGNRILLGGGRNLDFAGEQTLELQTTTPIITYLQNLLKTVIAPNLTCEIEQSWAGIMAFGVEKKPILRWHSQNVLLGVRCGGMGVAIGTNIGEEMAKLVQNS